LVLIDALSVGESYWMRVLDADVRKKRAEAVGGCVLSLVREGPSF
jgi:hypothetical protein